MRKWVVSAFQAVGSGQQGRDEFLGCVAGDAEFIRRSVRRTRATTANTAKAPGIRGLQPLPLPLSDHANSTHVGGQKIHCKADLCKGG